MKPDAEGTMDKYAIQLPTDGVAIEFHSSDGCPYKKILEEVKKQEELTRNYYMKLRDENLVLEKQLNDVVRHCNGILRIIREMP